MPLGFNSYFLTFTVIITWLYTDYNQAHFPVFTYKPITVQQLSTNSSNSVAITDVSELLIFVNFKLKVARMFKKLFGCTASSGVSNTEKLLWNFTHVISNPYIQCTVFRFYEQKCLSNNNRKIRRISLPWQRIKSYYFWQELVYTVGRQLCIQAETGVLLLCGSIGRKTTILPSWMHKLITE